MSDKSFGLDFSSVQTIPEDPKVRLAYFQNFKSLIEKEKNNILSWRKESKAGGREVVQAITGLTDNVIMHVVKSLSLLKPYQNKQVLKKLSLIAVGGYGRGELNPCSDIDLLFLHPGKMTQVVDKFIQDVISILWGIGLEIGVSCRTLNDCKRLAVEDTTVKTSMIETRFLIGDAKLHQKLTDSVRKNVLKKNMREFLGSQLKAVFSRNEEGDQVLSDPEPDIKNGAGGLRDYHVAMWAVAAKFGTLSFREINRDEVIDENELDTFEQAVDFILQVRNELHYLLGKKSDILTHEIQEQIARNLAIEPQQGNSVVEEFMRQYFLNASHIHRISGQIFEKCMETEPMIQKLLKPFQSKDMGRGLVANKSALSLTDGREGAFSDPTLYLYVFDLCRDHDLTPDTPLRRLMVSSLGHIPKGFLQSVQVKDFLHATLSHPKSEIVLRKMHEIGFLGGLLTEFGRSHCKVRHDFYHRYTSDEHALRMIRFLEALPGCAEKSLRPLVGAFSKTRALDVLKLSCLLHDLGEATEASESLRASQKRMDFIQTLPLESSDKKKLEFLLHHLHAMNEIAFHQDMHQALTIQEFAQIVQTPERLDLLFLVSYAELKAVAPDTWTAWKKMLLLELYERTANYLERPDSFQEKPKVTKDIVLKTLANEISTKEIGAHLKQMPGDYLFKADADVIVKHLRMLKQLDGEIFVADFSHVPSGEFFEVVIAGFRRPDFFKYVVGSLTSKALDILGAQVYVRLDELVFIHLQVDANKLKQIHQDEKNLWREIDEHLVNLIEKKISLPQLLGSRTRLVGETSGKKGAILPKIIIDNLSDKAFTLVRIEARDHPGMLYKIAKVFSSYNIRIHRAKISVQGGRGIDVFLVSLHGKKIIQNVLIGRLKEQIIQQMLTEQLEVAYIEG